MPNRLAHETSPYLLQHADNPVDWYPWGDEAFEKARTEGKPVFLSVGYSACHWCHVMAHESFEDEATAALMNEHFVSVKVDREERPDVDSIYMDAIQALTGSGGWPMSVFLTPDGAPFFGGTYFPKVAREGQPSFTDILTQIAKVWEIGRTQIMEVGVQLTEAIREASEAQTDVELSGLDPEILGNSARTLLAGVDHKYGGWGGAPKFPQPAAIEFLLRRHHATHVEQLLDAATTTLRAMALGGIHDQLGGGFHRYSTDGFWLVPHFEKMLYDNAQLARVYLHAWQVTGDELYEHVATRTLDYVAREMLDESGGFYSAQDADSEGEEGRFFVWTPEQIRSALATMPGIAEDVALFMMAYGVTPGGNFDDKSILFVARTPAQIASSRGLDEQEVAKRLARVRAALFAARESRVKPGLDDKVLAGWNGLMLGAFAEAARVLRRDDYLSIAERNADFLLREMRTAEGRMLRTWKAREARLNGYLEDYAFVADGLLELYQTTFEPSWFHAARELGDAILEHFADPAGGFFDTSDDHESLLFRPRSFHDGAMPCGGSIAASVLLRLAEYTGDTMYRLAGERAIARLQSEMKQAPIGFANWLAALDFDVAPPVEVAIVGEPADEMLGALRCAYRPNVIVASSADAAAGEASGMALLESREAVGGETTAYVCRDFRCERPVTNVQEFEGLLGR